MGVNQSDGSLFLNVSTGYLRNKSKNIQCRSYTGSLIEISEKTDEFEGRPIDKVVLKMKDNLSDEIALISFTKGSWYSNGFFSRIQKVDLSKPFILGCSNSQEFEKVTFCWIRQGEIVGADKEKFAKPKKVKIDGDKIIDDWTEMINLLPAIIEEINGKVSKTEVASESVTETTEDDEKSDLPF